MENHLGDVGLWRAAADAVKIAQLHLPAEKHNVAGSRSLCTISVSVPPLRSPIEATACSQALHSVSTHSAGQSAFCAAHSSVSLRAVTTAGFHRRRPPGATMVWHNAARRANNVRRDRRCWFGDRPERDLVPGCQILHAVQQRPDYRRSHRRGLRRRRRNLSSTVPRSNP